MKRCPQCHAMHQDTVLTCDCGQELRGVRSEDAKERDSRISDSGQSPNTYAALETVGVLYGLLGWLIILFALVAGAVVAYRAFDHGQPGLGLLAFIACALGGCIIALPMLAARDVIRWMMEMTSHGHRIRTSIDALLARRGSSNE